MVVVQNACICTLYSCRQCMGSIPYLLPASLSDNILCILWVGLYSNLASAMMVHAERPYLGTVVVAHLLLFSIEPHSLGNHLTTLVTPHVVGDLKPDDKNPLVHLFGTLPQGMLPLKLQGT